MKWLGLVGIVAFSLIIGYTLSNQIIQTIIGLVPKEVQLVALQPSDGFMVIMWGTLIGTIIILMILGGLWLWIYYKDILYDTEKQFLKKIIPTSIFLFITGIVSGVLMYLVMVLPYFIQINTELGLTNIWSLGNVINSSIMIGLGFGVSFQLPLLLRFAIKKGLIKKESYTSQRLKIILVILILSAVLTPPDVISQLMLAIPLIGLTELAVM